MSKRAVFAGVVGLLGLPLYLFAQQPDSTSALDFYPSDIYGAADSSALVGNLPLQTLVDGRHLPISTALGQMGTMPADLFPLAYLRPAVKEKAKVAQNTSGKESPEEPAELRTPSDYTVHGEVGMFYGRSTGNYASDTFGSYLQSEVGNDKFQISVGAGYQETSGHIPRFGR